MLIAAVAKPTGIASGTWMNVRSFPPDKFKAQYDEEIKQRATWYYCPQTLSEYKIPFLDIARRQSALDSMASPADLNGGYAASLFSGGPPTSAAFSEPAAFRHYLHALHEQCRNATEMTFDDTVANHERALDGAETLLTRLNAVGIHGQHRDFAEVIAVNRAALRLFQTLRGAVLRRRWPAL
jgi:hypothetical protein